MMKALLSVFILLGSLFSFTVKAQETIWVPIMLGGITFFVPLGDAPVTPPPPPPPANTITDGNLLNCVNQAKIQNNWTTNAEVTELYCVAANIYDVTGIDSLVNLERLALGNNFISDVTPISGLNHLSWLHLASYQFTNQIYNDDIAILSQMPSLRNLVVNNTYVEPLEYHRSGFSTGFNGIVSATGAPYIGTGSSPLNQSHLGFIVELGPTPSTSLQCSFLQVFQRFPQPKSKFLPDSNCENPQP